MADLNFWRKWLKRRLAEADRIAAEETPYKPSLRLDLPPLGTQGEKYRYGFWSAILFLTHCLLRRGELPGDTLFSPIFMTGAEPRRWEWLPE